MIEAFRDGGVMMWPMLIVALGIAWTAVRTAVRVQRSPGAEDVRRGMQSVLFWGGVAALLGLSSGRVDLVLIWVGVKMLLKIDVFYIPTTISLAVVATIIGTSVALSLRATRGQGRHAVETEATAPFRVASAR